MTSTRQLTDSKLTALGSLQYLLTNKVIGADTEWSIEDLRMYMIRTPPGYSFVLLAKGKVILGARPEPERNEAYVAFRDIVEKKMGLHVLAEQRKKESEVVDMAM